MSSEHVLFLKKRKKEKILVLLFQILIFIVFILIWQVLSNTNRINTFLTSSPKLIYKTIINLINNNLFNHILVTTYETIISFILSLLIGIIIASILWWNKFISKVIDPYLTILNSLPKVALGPILIIWIGANTKSIIVMALLISSIISIITIYNGFNSTDDNKIKLMKSFNASKWQIYTMLVLRGNINTIINSLKINISMCLIGVIMGELLVSKEGIGYLIMYGSQVFNLNLVMTGIFLLSILSYILYFIISQIKKN
ncbi:MAG: ABC transporter permease subunit [Bacilli bacterium]|nr:ABC transporter permease subunit [Bacilli bacterium]MBQ6282472.1 ABC transporter permease subunit [Bacilli bacterium]